MDSSQLRGTLLVALSGTLFGSMGYLGTHLLSLGLSIENMLFWRFFLAAICLLICLFFFKKHHLLKHYSAASLLKISLWGTACYSASTAAYFMASIHVGTGIAMVLMFSFPVFVCLFAWVLGRWQINFFAVVSLLAVVVGLFCLKEPGVGALKMTGFLFGIFSAIGYAVYVYNSKYHAQDIDALWLTFLVCMGNAVVFFIWSYSSGSFYIPELSVWIYLLALAIIATLLPIWLLLEGLKSISSVKASIVSVFEPVMTLFLGIILLGEFLSPVQLLGVVIILVAAVVIQFEK